MIGADHFPLFCCHNRGGKEMDIVRVVQNKIERECKGWSIQKIRGKVVDRGFPHIHSQEYMIYLFSEIFIHTKI